MATTLIHTLKILSSPSTPTTLHTFQPSPSTVTYTVSTRRRQRHEPKSAIETASYYTGIAVRVIIGVAVLSAFWMKFRGRGDAWVGRMRQGGSEESRATGAEGMLFECLRKMVEVVEGCRGLHVGLGGMAGLWMVLKRGYKGTVTSLLLHNVYCCSA